MDFMKKYKDFYLHWLRSAWAFFICQSRCWWKTTFSRLAKERACHVFVIEAIYQMTILYSGQNICVLYIKGKPNPTKQIMWFKDNEIT